MARTKRWNFLEVTDGVGTVELSSWKYFNDFIYQEMLDFRHYVWRGHRCDDWLLEPTLDRVLRNKGKRKQQSLRQQHLQNFKFAARGRRGPQPPSDLKENDWWALGQHYGLATPLLDWTESPFVAAYFAFVNEGAPQTRRRALFAVNPESLAVRSKQIQDEQISITFPHSAADRLPIVESVRPLSDDNPRLANQGGLFTRSPDTVDLESWVREHAKGEGSYVLMKLTIPNKDRQMALRSLNRMNVNHLSLFPDLFGASQHCNLDLAIDKY